MYADRRLLSGDGRLQGYPKQDGRFCRCGRGVGFTNCGGCPGKKAVLRARELVKRGADTIAFASCIQKGTPIGYPCPFGKKMKSIVENDLGDSVRLLDYTH